jgi:hypothetical protein
MVGGTISVTKWPPKFYRPIKRFNVLHCASRFVLAFSAPYFSPTSVIIIRTGVSAAPMVAHEHSSYYGWAVVAKAWGWCFFLQGFEVWYRVFCRSDNSPSPSSLLEHLHSSKLPVAGRFKGDDLGWTSAELSLGCASPVYVERFLAGEDNLRNDLNSWAAFLETCDYSPNHQMLMERVIQSQQMITLRKPIDHADEISVDRLCLALCSFLAQQADGVYQIDNDGWYDAAGALLLQEY